MERKKSNFKQFLSKSYRIGPIKKKYKIAKAQWTQKNMQEPEHISRPKSKYYRQRSLQLLLLYYTQFHASRIWWRKKMWTFHILAQFTSTSPISFFVLIAYGSTSTTYMRSFFVCFLSVMLDGICGYITP